MVTNTPEGIGKRRGRPRQFDEDEVLDRAVALLWREGPTALSLNDLAERLNMAKPALARTFGNKDDLLTAVLRRYGERVEAGLWEAVAEATTQQEVARTYLLHYAERLAQKPVGPATGCLLAAATEATAASEGKVAQTTHDLNARNRLHLEHALSKVGATDATALATFLYGQSVALAFLSRSGTDAAALRDFAERAIKGVGDRGCRNGTRT